MAGPGLNLVRSLARDGSMKARFLTYGDAKRRALVHARPRMAGPGLNLVRSLARDGSMKARFLTYGDAKRRASVHARPRMAGPGLNLVRSLARDRSEEHASELQSLMRISYAVFCLKKKNKNTH